MSSLLDVHLTRRSWLLLSAWGLSGCGGGGSSTALPGTGGTGAVFAQGTISGFGSVIVNGIKFDDGLASVMVNGASATPADLRLGMVAQIQGQRDANVATLGTASSIEVWSMAQGTVSALTAGGFVLSGMTILTDASPVLEGLDSVAQIAVGQTLVVWGMQSNADASLWRATRVALLASASSVVSTGMVRMTAEAATLNGLLLKGGKVDSKLANTLVRVEGTLSAPGVLQVSQVQTLSQAATAQTEGGAQLEGYVTQVISASRFKLGMTEVDASHADMPSAVASGDRVEVHGSWLSGVLVADSVAIETDTEMKSTEITGTVSAFTSIADFVLREQRCDASRAQFSHGAAGDLRPGVRVKVKGTRSGALLLVNTLEFDS